MATNCHTRQDSFQSEANHKSRPTHKHKSLAPIYSTHLKRQQEYLFNKEQIALMVCFEIVYVECRSFIGKNIDN